MSKNCTATIGTPYVYVETLFNELEIRVRAWKRSNLEHWFSNTEQRKFLHDTKRLIKITKCVRCDRTDINLVLYQIKVLDFFIPEDWLYKFMDNDTFEHDPWNEETEFCQTLPPPYELIPPSYFPLPNYPTPSAPIAPDTMIRDLGDQPICNIPTIPTQLGLYPRMPVVLENYTYPDRDEIKQVLGEHVPNVANEWAAIQATGAALYVGGQIHKRYVDHVQSITHTQLDARLMAYHERISHQRNFMRWMYTCIQDLEKASASNTSLVTAGQTLEAKIADLETRLNAHIDMTPAGDSSSAVGTGALEAHIKDLEKELDVLKNASATAPARSSSFNLAL
ncbi:hypothetical protein WOLCODRAFT_21504 [Wolfiporia cocos MD-104 SS10]|uniref:Uncharacterized protein n=1 Tax=Wolfiporia cocos (strain MD-104) TaxID=742152 RepID=A0A2H3JBA4_WOLCO|nr:hypothetical protein WOLCODRAFT_21504 [Wolfiporia cocos MD-104 SS10]